MKKKTEGFIYIILTWKTNFFFLISLPLFLYSISLMLLLKLATLALTCTVASTTALSDSVIPFLDNLVDEINHNNEKPCADVDCLYRIRTTGSYNTKDFALYLGKISTRCNVNFFSLSYRILKLTMIVFYLTE